MTTPTPRTVRLRSGIQTVNGITGETAPTYSEYVLLEDYQRDLAAAQEARERAADNIERLAVQLEAAHAHITALKDDRERAEALAESLKADAERYRKARRNGGFFFSSDRMTDAEIDARIDELPDYVDDISSGELSAAIARGKE